MSAHPYIPNTAPSVRRQMLDAIGVTSIDELFTSIPERLRAPQQLGLPKALPSEIELRRYFETALRRNSDTSEFLSFLGGGCWTHSVPAVCDEIANRGELFSSMIGLGGASTTGAYQALFEYQSLICELVGLDLSCLPLYDWGWAAGSAMLMATRATGRNRVLVADTVAPNRRREIATRFAETIEIELVGHVAATGAIDLDDLRAKAAGTAALYFENPSYLGYLEPELDQLSRITAEAGSLLIAGVDPTSLGIVRDPGSYGADIACGDLQPLGTHAQFGGGSAGFLACRMGKSLEGLIPSIYIAAYPTVRDGEHDFFFGNFDQTSYERRSESDEVIGGGSIGTGVTAAVYLSLMGPKGMEELGNGLRARAGYLTARLSDIPGIVTKRLTGIPFKEFVIDFSGTGKSVAAINDALLERSIFGGIPLEGEFLELTGCALYSVTEMHSRQDLDRLAEILKEIVQ